MLKTPELAMPRAHKVTTVCNGRREVWTDYEEAKAYFLELMMFTDGEEHERAECIYIQLLHGLDECSDEDDQAEERTVIMGSSLLTILIIAVDACKKNTEPLCFPIRIIQDNISSFKPQKKYKYIFSNPPLSCNLPINTDVAKLNSNIESGIIDNAAFRFLTNCWRDNKGHDFMENIFIRIDELLMDSGKLIVVCGNPYEDVISYLIELANKYNLNLEKKIQGYVPATAIGFSDESLPAVATSILVFNK